MKITETTARECCHPSLDLVQYKGKTDLSAFHGLKFCIHCGQYWYWTRNPGELDYGYERVEFPIGK